MVYTHSGANPQVTCLQMGGLGRNHLADLQSLMWQLSWGNEAGSNCCFLYTPGSSSSPLGWLQRARIAKVFPSCQRGSSWHFLWKVRREVHSAGCHKGVKCWEDQIVREVLAQVGSDNTLGICALAKVTPRNHYQQSTEGFGKQPAHPWLQLSSGPLCNRLLPPKPHQHFLQSSHAGQLEHHPWSQDYSVLPPSIKLINMTEMNLFDAHSSGRWEIENKERSFHGDVAPDWPEFTLTAYHLP